MGMDQYLLIPFLGGWTSIYQLFWCSPGVQGFDTLPNGKSLNKQQMITCSSFFVDYQRLTMVPTCSSMCFNDLLCSSSCCDDDRKLSMSDWACVWTHVWCVTPLRLKLYTMYIYIYIWVVDSDCIFHRVAATCRYECMLSIHMMSWIIWYTWIYMDIHGYTWIYMCAWSHFRFFFLVNSKVPDGDILIHCGDMTNRGSAPELQEVNAWFEERRFCHGGTRTIFFMDPRGLMKLLGWGPHNSNFTMVLWKPT